MNGDPKQLAARLKTKLDAIKDRDLPLEAKLLLEEARGLCSELVLAVGGGAATAAPKEAAKRLVLIVDDDEDVQRTLRYLLPKRGGFEVLSLTDPLKAVDTIKTKKPDVVLMDLMMPGLTGFELLQRLRADAETSGVKVIIGSSRSYDKDRVAVLESGAHDFIAKPYNIAELVLRLKHLLG